MLILVRVIGALAFFAALICWLGVIGSLSSPIIVFGAMAQVAIGFTVVFLLTAIFEVLATRLPWTPRPVNPVAWAPEPPDVRTFADPGPGAEPAVIQHPPPVPSTHTPMATPPQRLRAAPLTREQGQRIVDRVRTERR